MTSTCDVRKFGNKSIQTMKVCDTEHANSHSKQHTIIHTKSYQTSDLVVKMKYMSDSSAIHFAGSGRGFVPWCLYISEYKCLHIIVTKYLFNVYYINAKTLQVYIIHVLACAVYVQLKCKLTYTDTQSLLYAQWEVHRIAPNINMYTHILVHAHAQ